MSHSSNIAEAQQCEKKAAECLKTSVLKLKFNPDFDGAAMHLERAAVCYRNASDIEKSAAVLLQAAGHYEKIPNVFHAAKARESAAMLLRDAGKYADAFSLFEQAIEGYALSGSLDTAAMTVEKAAKVIEQNEPEKAIALYQRGLVLVQQADRSKMAGEFLSRISRLYLKLQKYDEACSSIKEEIEKYIEVNEPLRVGQLAIGLVLAQLAKEDSVQATNYYGYVINSMPVFEDSEEARLCRQLISSYQDGDDESFQNVLKSGNIRSMDNEFLRLQRRLKVPQSEAPTNADDDEDEDDLR